MNVSPGAEAGASASSFALPAKKNGIAVPDRVTVLMRLLNDAAEKAAACPTNMEIADAIGVRGIATAANAISLLEAMNLIRVERGVRNRVVTIVSTGKRTGGMVRSAHPRAIGQSIWNDDRDAELMDAMSEGATFLQAAERLGLGYEQVRQRFNALAAVMGAGA
jgi:DNA-binding MarR family transcriptional regulator